MTGIKISIPQPVKNMVKDHINKSLKENSKYPENFALAVNIGTGLVEAAWNIKKAHESKKLSDDEKKFLISYDVIEETLAIILQAGLGLFVLKKGVQDKLFKFIFKGISKKTHEETKMAKKALSLVTSITASAVLGKRVLVPLIATPLSLIVKNNSNKKTPAKKSKGKQSIQPKLDDKINEKLFMQFNKIV